MKDQVEEGKWDVACYWPARFRRWRHQPPTQTHLHLHRAPGMLRAPKGKTQKIWKREYIMM